MLGLERPVIVLVPVVVRIMVLVWYVDHIGRALRVSALIELVRNDTRKLLDKIYADAGATNSGGSTIPAPQSRVIIRKLWQPQLSPIRLG